TGPHALPEGQNLRGLPGPARHRTSRQEEMAQACGEGRNETEDRAGSRLCRSRRRQLQEAETHSPRRAARQQWPCLPRRLPPVAKGAPSPECNKNEELAAAPGQDLFL